MRHACQTAFHTVSLKMHPYLLVLLCAVLSYWSAGCKKTSSPQENQAEQRPAVGASKNHPKSPGQPPTIPRPAPAPVAPPAGAAAVPKEEKLPAVQRHHAMKREKKPAVAGDAPSPPSAPDVVPKPSAPADERGVMNFNPPKTMTRNVAVPVDVAIRRPAGAAIPLIPSDADASGKYGLAGGGPVQGVEVAVADVMDVELRAADATAFTITPSDDQRKSVEPGGHAEWHWTVTPLKAGEQRLLLHSMRIRTLSNGKHLPPTDDDTTVALIDVNVLPWWQRMGPALGKLLADNWKSILVFLLPGGGGAILLAWWRNRKKRSDGEKQGKT